MAERSASLIAGGVERRPVRYVLNMEKDIPLLVLIRNSTYITQRQIYALWEGDDSAKAIEHRLYKLRTVGQLQEHGLAFPYPSRVLSITRAGLSTLEAVGRGLLSVSSDSEHLADPLQVHHYLGLNRTQTLFREMFPGLKWIGDRELRSLNIIATSTTVKDYDAVVDLPGAGKDERTIKLAIEFERTPKSKERYAEIRGQIANESKVDGVLYVTEDEMLSLLVSREVYTKTCQVGSVTIGELLENRMHGRVKTARDMTIVREQLSTYLQSL